MWGIWRGGNGRLSFERTTMAGGDGSEVRRAGSVSGRRYRKGSFGERLGSVERVAGWIKGYLEVMRDLLRGNEKR